MSQSLTLTAGFFLFFLCNCFISQLILRIWICIHTFIIQTYKQSGKDIFPFMQVCEEERGQHILFHLNFLLDSRLFSKSIQLLTKTYYRHLMFDKIITLTINLFVPHFVTNCLLQSIRYLFLYWILFFFLFCCSRWNSFTIFVCWNNLFPFSFFFKLLQNIHFEKKFHLLFFHADSWTENNNNNSVSDTKITKYMHNYTLPCE